MPALSLADKRKKWSSRWELNPRPLPYQGSALPLSHKSRSSFEIKNKRYPRPCKAKFVCKFSGFKFEVENGAGDKIRTCDIHLGRVALYQLSYARIKLLVRNGGERRIRTFEGINRQIYSLLPLAARQSLLNSSSHLR